MDNESMKTLLTVANERGMGWFTGAFIMGIVALVSIARIIFR